MDWVVLSRVEETNSAIEFVSEISPANLFSKTLTLSSIEDFVPVISEDISLCLESTESLAEVMLASIDAVASSIIEETSDARLSVKSTVSSIFWIILSISSPNNSSAESGSPFILNKPSVILIVFSPKYNVLLLK